MYKLCILLFLFVAGHVPAAEICGPRNVLSVSYPIALTLTKLLCDSEAKQSGFLTRDAANASPHREIQWLAKTWGRNYKDESKVSIERIIDTSITECDRAATENMVMIMLFRKQLYVQAIFFGSIPKSKPIQDFSEKDAKTEHIARVKTTCGIDLGSKEVTWQILDN